MLCFYKIDQQYLNVEQIRSVRWYPINHGSQHRVEIISILGDVMHSEWVDDDPDKRAAEILMDISAHLTGD